MAASVVLADTITNDVTEAAIVAGGRTLTLTLTGDTFVAAGAAFNAQRQAIINGIDSAQAEATGWDAEVKAKAAVTEVVRTSSTVCTITYAAQAAYNITAIETITAIVPGAALTGAAPLTAPQTFTVRPIITVGITQASSEHARPTRVIDSRVRSATATAGFVKSNNETLDTYPLGTG